MGCQADDGRFVVDGAQVEGIVDGPLGDACSLSALDEGGHQVLVAKPVEALQIGGRWRVSSGAVSQHGTILVPVHGAEPDHDLAAIQDLAQAKGLDASVQDQGKELARDSNKLARSKRA